MRQRRLPEQPWVLVAGGFHARGGMDKANLVLAEYLAERGRPVHLVCHLVDERLAAHANVTVHRAALPAKSYFLGGPLLDLKARRVAAALRRRGMAPRTVVNGGNCMLDDVNWSHFVHGAWTPSAVGGSLPARWKRDFERSMELNRERRAYARARLVVANSEATAQHIRRSIGEKAAGAAHIQVIYLGSETAWGPITASERRQAREALGIAPERKVAAFVGGLGFDGRKGFDVLLNAWRKLCQEPSWDADLLVAGTGPAFEFWNAQVKAADLSGRIRMMGFREDVAGLLAATDVLVSTPRYEPYGLNIQEAMARGLPVVCSAGAGVAERFPASVSPLLLGDTESDADLVECLRAWRSAPDLWRERFAGFSRPLCERTWTDMAEEMTTAMDRAAAPRTAELLSHAV